MLLSERKHVPASDEWRFELKYDGIRILASTDPVRLQTKGGADATAWFPELAAGLASLGPGHILDGEVCCLDDIGRSDFDRVLRRARRRRWYPGADLVVYCVFDLLVKSGRDIRGQTYERRKAALSSLLSKRPASLLYVDHDHNGRWLFEQALALQLEGIVGKRVSSTYQAGIRSPDWIKIKRPGSVPPNRFRQALR